MIGMDTKKKEPKKEKKISEARDVEFSLYAPEATKVFVAGEFNGWDIQSLPMKRQEDGLWKVITKLLPRRYEYKMLSERGWVEDLPGEERVSNPFGTQNFVRWVK